MGNQPFHTARPDVPIELTDRYLNVDGLRVRYWDAGAGPPLLLIHGLAVPIESWRHTIPALAEHYRVIAPDIPGFGDSSLPDPRWLEGGQPWEAVGGLLRQLLGDLGVTEPASVVGHSMGGLVAVRYALMDPRSVRRLILVDAAGLGREIHPLARVASVRPVAESLLHPIRPFARLLTAFLAVQPDAFTPDFVDALVRHASRPGAKQAIIAYLRCIADRHGQSSVYTPADLRALTMPVLVVWGQQDRALPVAHAEKALHAISDCRAVTFEQTGHAPQLERPGTFNQLLLEFLEQGRLRAESPHAGQVIQM